jgi:hypothetical protein
MRMAILERLEQGRAGQILCNRRKTGQKGTNARQQSPKKSAGPLLAAQTE